MSVSESQSLHGVVSPLPLLITCDTAQVCGLMQAAYSDDFTTLQLLRQTTQM